MNENINLDSDKIDMSKKFKKTPEEIKLSKSDVKVGGVVGGISDHFKKDSAWVRVGAVVLIILTGIIPGLIIYGVFYTLMNKSEEGKKS
ncbi:MAG: PspC protein [Patescibacteria group bacterium]|nr:PspC protein [Patescibacteria group bacterium]